MPKNNNYKIAIVTPLRNEVKNIDRLFDSISKQTVNIFSWVILENGSTDGSIEKLKKINSPSNVNNIEIINLTKTSINYQLGSNYARINNYGFNLLKEKSYYDKIDFIGILDSDIFLEENYYEKLIDLFVNDKNLGISSGIILNFDGKIENTSNKWVRGGCRLWRKQCFDQSGYIVGPSADSLSTAKAICNNWKVYPEVNAIAYSRPVGSRVNYKYYGEASYFRGCSVVYILLKSIYYLFKMQFRASYGLFLGYFEAMFLRKERVQDNQIINYYKYYPFSRYLFKVKFKKSI